MSASYSISSPGAAVHACNCMGPQRGEPYCPCLMRGVIERDGRWIVPERDLGPVQRRDNRLARTLADATPTAKD